MGTISLTDAVTLTEIQSSLINNNNALLEGVINGNIENVNVKTGAAIAVSKLAPGTAGQFLRTTGGVAVWETYTPGLRVLEQLGATNDIVSSSSETTIYSFSVPGNTLGTNGSLLLELYGDWLANSGTPDLTFRVKFGGTTFHAAARTSIAASANRGSWHLRVGLQNRNATNSNHIHGELAMSDRTPPTTGIGQHDTNDLFTSCFSSDATDPAIDTTTAKTIDVTAQWSAASASLSFRRKSATLILQLV